MQVTLREVGPQDIATVHPWLTDPDNAKWLAPFFQNPLLREEQLALFLMRRDRKTYLLLCDGVPVGLMGLTSIDDVNRSAEVWSVIGERAYRQRGLSTIGFVLTLQKAFGELALHSVNAWAAEGNHTIRIFEKLGFTRIGRQRECHRQHGEYKDRILFDIVSTELDRIRAVGGDAAQA
ncbi:MAG TPA: GNAT family protein [Vicinamibacterales bacterium]|nr:GNAT family protein [Vicinamibacterales bacterium]